MVSIFTAIYHHMMHFNLTHDDIPCSRAKIDLDSLYTYRYIHNIQLFTYHLSQCKIYSIRDIFCCPTDKVSTHLNWFDNAYARLCCSVGREGERERARQKKGAYGTTKQQQQQQRTFEIKIADELFSSSSV